MFVIRQLPEFQAWTRKLRDPRAKARIADRLERVEEGNLGDHKTFQGLIEFRIVRAGLPALRLPPRGGSHILLCGGDTSSQDRDIKRAIDLAKEV